LQATIITFLVSGWVKFLQEEKKCRVETADQYFTNNAETKARNKGRKLPAVVCGRGKWKREFPSELQEAPNRSFRVFPLFFQTPTAENPSIMQFSIFQQIETELATLFFCWPSLQHNS